MALTFIPPTSTTVDNEKSNFGNKSHLPDGATFEITGAGAVQIKVDQDQEKQRSFNVFHTTLGTDIFFTMLTNFKIEVVNGETKIKKPNGTLTAKLYELVEKHPNLTNGEMQELFVKELKGCTLQIRKEHYITISKDGNQYAATMNNVDIIATPQTTNKSNYSADIQLAWKMVAEVLGNYNRVGTHGAMLNSILAPIIICVSTK
jgi:hypothetical protein